MIMPVVSVALCLLASLACASGCADDIRYLVSPSVLEVGPPLADDEIRDSISLPIRIETTDEREQRWQLAEQLGYERPFVGLSDLSISIEFTVKNLDDRAGEATLHVDGANEWFAYDPEVFDLDPEERRTPSLVPGIPVIVPALSMQHGIVREDRLFEAAIDLELISRGGLNPFAAIFQRHEDLDEIVIDTAAGTSFPREAFAHLVRLDLRFVADTHMVCEYVVRVRDHRGLLHPHLLAAPAAELTPFVPADIPAPQVSP